ncbi:MAG: phage exclusion protein Lit family protein [Candidatus Odinarchaeia archaeon]
MARISVLHNNLIYRFENMRPHFKKSHLDAVKAKKISPEIAMDCSKSTVIAPKVNCGTRQIYLQETFLCYLWSVCHYALWVHEHIQQRQKGKNWDGKVDYGDSSLVGCRELIEWALSLRQFYSTWHSKLPNPETFGSVPEEQIGKTNAVYIDAAVYILFHEYAHLISDHCQSVSELRLKALHDSSENYRLVEIEKEADNYAMEAIISPSDDRLWIRTKGLAMLTAHLAMLLLPLQESQVIQADHPDLDVRLQNALLHLPQFDKETQYYHWHFVGFSMQIFFALHGLNACGPHEFEKVEDLVEHYLTVFDSMKNV